MNALREYEEERLAAVAAERASRRVQLDEVWEKDDSENRTR